MIELGGYADEDITSSDALRTAILSEHERLRTLLSETAGRAAAMTGSAFDLDELRAWARSFYVALEEHLTFEARAFPPALRDVIGWGSVLQAQIEETHARQRETLARARLRPPEVLSAEELAGNLRVLATDLLSDIEREDAALLHADLDAIATDGTGG
ncbi:MAG TPA: hemerythrin domain-containing protein [Polyangia bacterium]|nr:hemerythrin domain-containing protein [Polyangia bacterium]